MDGRTFTPSVSRVSTDGAALGETSQAAEFSPQPVRPLFYGFSTDDNPQLSASGAPNTPVQFTAMWECPWFDIHSNLASYTYTMAPISSYGDSERLKEWGQWDILKSLANYRSDVNILLEALKSTVMSPELAELTATEVSERLSRDVSAVLQALVSVLTNAETYKSFLAYRGPPAQQLLDIVQDLLDSTCDATSRHLLSKALMRLSRESGAHPTCFVLPDVEKVGRQRAAGSFGDVYKGSVDGHSVSIKSMRLFEETDVKAALKEFGREALLWRQLSHPNILPFFGLYYLDSRLCLVSPWMENGDLVQFLKKAPSGTDPTSLILDIALGLEYLHRELVVHGDLKASNILVTPSGRACIADFGLSSVASAMTMRFTHSTVSRKNGTMRWQAPELLRGENVNHFGSDMYAFACVCYEILSGKVPFYELPEPAVIFKVTIDRVRPGRPVFWEESEVYNGIWQLMEECWKEEFDGRPTAMDIVQRLGRAPIRAKQTQLEMDWDHTFSSQFRCSLQNWPLLPSSSQITRKLFARERIIKSTPEYPISETGTPHLSHRPHSRPSLSGDPPWRSLPPMKGRVTFPHNSNDKHCKDAATAQLELFEDIFKRDTKPNASLRKKIATELNTTPRGAQVWFQNRRAKQKTKASKTAQRSLYRDVRMPSQQFFGHKDSWGSDPSGCYEFPPATDSPFNLVTSYGEGLPSNAGGQLSPENTNHLHSVSSRDISAPIPGPLPAADFSFSAANTSPDRRSPIDFDNFSFPPDESDTDTKDHSSASWQFSRFSSVDNESLSTANTYFPLSSHDISAPIPGRLPEAGFSFDVANTSPDHSSPIDFGSFSFLPDESGRRQSCPTGFLQLVPIEYLPQAATSYFTFLTKFPNLPKTEALVVLCVGLDAAELLSQKALVIR
ncbi:hypothetical protein DFH08DRAFT_836665 [Mycena albidolilacea]|uniref:Uncharacterized protein n=1 Tax=Mycena albidolilacea TaxID=1033008 RepID=A0AAD7ASI3_9AGAR|nr:hypothetical protein DFH08DRAFT_836665 [Mycena albidolilacea]